MTDSAFRLNRRELLNSAVAIGAGTLLPCSVNAECADGDAPAVGIVDTNVSLFQWPCRRLPLDETEVLVQKLRALGIVRAWAGSFEGILHRDISGVNQRLAEECRKHPELLPIGSVNPALPGWEADLLWCREAKIHAIRLHPNYHGYLLDDPRLGRLLKLAGESGLLVQLAIALEDTRTQHHLLKVADVDLAPLPELLRQTPGVRVQLLNWRPVVSLLEQLRTLPGILFDTARTEGTDGIAVLFGKVPVERVLFGSHAPFLIPEAALIRVAEASLEDQILRALLAENAVRLGRK